MSEIQKDEQKLYEVGFHIVPSVTPEKLSGEVAVITKTITSHNGVVTKEIEPKLINLAYEMSKKILDANYRFTKAYFGSITFTAAAADADLVKSELEKNNSILRFLLIKTVDDPEHSTNKIPREQTDEVEPIAEAVDEGVDIGAEEPVEVDTENSEKGQKTVDAAIDDLVK